MVVCFTGGGTLGHVYPALAVHQELTKEAEYEGFWIGRTEEQAVIQDAGLKCYVIPTGKLRRYFSLRTIGDFFHVIRGIFASYRILKKTKPDVLFSKGGFVSVPPVFAAHLLKIPIISHESDITPGLATRINSRFSSRICVPYPTGFDHLGKEKLVVTGNPVRRELVEAAKNPPVKESKQLNILVLGGSSGSGALNTLIAQTIDELTQWATVIHQVGRSQELIAAQERYTPLAYIDSHLADYLHNADLVITRSGAGILEELKLFGKAALLLPLGRLTSRGEQEANARYLAEVGAAVVLYEPVTSDEFVATVRKILSDAQWRKDLGLALGAQSNAHAAATISALIIEWRK
ncbi:MAG: UDP-N-acetylglucosamine--N-acetylmuramyl-(pentapeptide) pyrophosphoryl-undecaprenol N-acetylglucosamine transferase [Sphaerochaeta sp.]